MQLFLQIIQNPYFMSAFVGWFAAQFLKVVVDSIIYRRVILRKFIGSGGMPSSHSSLAVALAACVGRGCGLDSAQFAISAAFAAIVMYDAAGVRRETGTQGRMLNWMAENWPEEDAILYEKKLQEVVGHTPLEVFAGAVLGIVIGLIWPM